MNKHQDLLSPLTKAVAAGGLFALASCKTVPADPPSETKQIFAVAQRDSPKDGEAPYVMHLELGCTAFFLDAARGIGMSATHCGIEVGSGLCFRSVGGSSLAACPARDKGEIAEILESSPINRLDYVIFRAAPAADADWPKRAKGIKIAGKDGIKALFQAKAEVRMYGYPADKLQKGALTVSWGRARSEVLAESPNFTGEKGEAKLERNMRLIAAWAADTKYNGRTDYEVMRRECWIIDDDVRAFRPSFRHDLSTYGGNSGGPMVAAGAVIAMPATYYPEPDGSVWEQPCFDKYWDTYFRPVLDADAPKDPWGFPNWNTLDRDAEDLKDFPLAIPLHLVAQASAYFKLHPEYVAP